MRNPSPRATQDGTHCLAVVARLSHPGGDDERMHQQGRDARLALLAGRQGAAFSFRQALELGYPRATVHRRLASGAWERNKPGVFVLAGSERTRLQDLWTASLAVGPSAVLTHESAALVHGAERLPSEPTTFTVPHGGHHRLAGVVVHQIDDLSASHCQRWRGMVISRPARVVVELGATQSVEMIGRVADDLLRMRKTTMTQIATVFAQIARPGKPGIERVARVLDERGDGYVPPHSELERALFDTLAAGGLPPPVRQLPLPGRDRVHGIADGGYPDAMIVLEADGRRWHDRLAASAQDRERDRRAARVGWQTLRWVYEQIVDDPGEVCSSVRETRQVRLDLFRGAA